MDRTPKAIGKDVKKVISFHFGMYRYQVEHFDHNEEHTELAPGLLILRDDPMKRGTKIYRFIDWPKYNRLVAKAIEFDKFLEEEDIKKLILADSIPFQVWDPDDFKDHFLAFENDRQAEFHYIMNHREKKRVDHGYPECEFPYEKCPCCGGDLDDSVLETDDAVDIFNSFSGSGPDGTWSSWEEVHRCPHCDKLFFIEAEN